MKKTPVFLVLLLSLLHGLGGTVQNMNANDVINLDKIIALVRAGDIDRFDQVTGHYSVLRERLDEELLQIFNDPTASDKSRGSAVFFLGELHDSKAVDALAANITFKLKPFSMDHLTVLHGPLCSEALVKIGNSSIPAVIRNLAESDNVHVRESSLEVIVRIDNDRDISVFRLQKALKTETDSQKQMRLKSALDALIGDNVKLTSQP